MAKLQIGVNDLATTFPELAAQWHPDKNGDLSPSMVTAHSKKKAWWLGKCGHEWNAEIYSRTVGRGCPYCANKKLLRGFNDLLTLYPQIASEWSVEKNSPLTPSDVVPGTHQKVWWFCKKCGFEWIAEIRMRVRGTDCPECAKSKMGDTFRSNMIDSGAITLQNAFPELSMEWDYEKNKPYTPGDFTISSSKSVWWKCAKCGNSWNTSISNRTCQQSGCPVCTHNQILTGYNDLATLNPDLAKEWHPSKNLPLTPQTVGARSGQNIWWICKFGHEYQCRISDRIRGVGCSKCSKRFHTSLNEKAVLFYLSRYNIRVQGSYHAKWLGRTEIDIFLPDKNIGIEYDGQRYHQDIDRDLKKDRLCKENNVCLIRIRESQCPILKRDAPTIILANLSNAALSQAIRELFNYLEFYDADIDIDRDLRNIIAFYRDTATKGNLQEVYPQLADEFLSEKNSSLLPINIPASHSKEKYYWKCSVCGYEWKTSLNARLAGSRCPNCVGITIQRVKVIQYYLEKSNIRIQTPFHICWLGNARIDIFLPDKGIGIEYDKQRHHKNKEYDLRKDRLCQQNKVILLRIREPNCPIIEREDPTFLLSDLSNTEFSRALHDVFKYLQIEKSDIDVERDLQSISAFYRRRITTSELYEDYPLLIKEFQVERNGNLIPENIPATYSKEKYYWKCSTCGYEWQAALGERINGTGCPACAGKVIVAGRNDLATTNPELVKEWHPTRNGDVTPRQVSKGSDYRAWWKCSVCGYEWQVRIKNRVHGSGCNRCAANKRSASLRKKVYQYSLSGELIQEFDGVAAAAEATGVSKSAIKNACNPNIKLQTAGGYKWSYNKSE